jgi:hypothetical protein
MGEPVDLGSPPTSQLARASTSPPRSEDRLRVTFIGARATFRRLTSKDALKGLSGQGDVRRDAGREDERGLGQVAPVPIPLKSDVPTIPRCEVPRKK